MGVTITPVVIVSGVTRGWTVRSGPNHSRHGDPYVTSGYIARMPGEIAQVEALTGPVLCRCEVEALKALLRPEGILRITWERYRKDGSVHTAWINV